MTDTTPNKTELIDSIDESDYESIQNNYERTTTVQRTLLGIGTVTAFYPLHYARTLIQLGYEPMEPDIRRSYMIFGKKVLHYPSTFSYVKYIQKTSGISGLYAGLGYRLTEYVLSQQLEPAIGDFVNAVFPLQELQEPADREDADDLPFHIDVQIFLRKSWCRSITALTTTTILHPLHVLMVRSMAQFIGEEEIYTSFNPFSSALAIYRENGIGGFFAGLAPQLMSVLVTVWVTQLLEFIVNQTSKRAFDEKFRDETRKQGFPVKPLIDLIAGNLAYKYSVVSTCMAVTRSGLTAGRPPCMPCCQCGELRLRLKIPLDQRYSNWKDCYRDLKDMGALNRGSSLFLRPVPRGDLTRYGFKTM